MSELVIRPFRESEAVVVASWSYEAPYDVYNGDPARFADYLAIDDDGYGYYAVASRRDEQVVGFCCFGAKARVVGQEPIEGTVDIGGGVRPDLLGQRLATTVFPAVIEFARRRFAPSQLRTVVAAFNERSTRLCLSAGFGVARRFDGPGGQFQELQRPA